MINVTFAINIEHSRLKHTKNASAVKKSNYICPVGNQGPKAPSEFQREDPFFILFLVIPSRG